MEEYINKILSSHKNIIVEGDISSGKTTNVLFQVVDNIIEKKNNFFVFDPKEEYINNYYDILKENNYNIITINFRNMYESEGWNPLSLAYETYKKGNIEQANEYIEKVVKELIKESSNSDPFWTNTAIDFVTGIIIALFEDGEKEEINLNSVLKMMNSIDEKYSSSDYLTEYIKNKGLDSKAYLYTSSTIKAPKDTKASILSVAKQYMRLYLSNDKLLHLTKKSTFKISKNANEPTAIFLISKDESKSYLNNLVTLFIEQLYEYLLQTRNVRKFNFILDNFDVFDKDNDFMPMLSSCLSRNIRIFIATRSLDEIIEKYSKYILKICDVLSIKRNVLKLQLSDELEEIPKLFKTIQIENVSIDYPELDLSEIKTFDIKSFVEDREVNYNLFDEKIEVEKHVSFTNLINEISEQIDLNKDDDSITSELEQFKI